SINATTQLSGVRSPFSLRLEKPLFEAIPTPFLMARHSPGRALISSHGAHQVPLLRGTASVVIGSRDERLRLLNRATNSHCRLNRVLRESTIACRLAATESEKDVAANRTELNQCRSSKHSTPIQPLQR